MTDPYLHNREFFGTVSGNYRILTGDTGLIVLVPAIPAHTLFIQKLHIEVTTPTGAELWTFQDGAGIQIVPAVSAAAVSHFDFDFGPDGVPCTQATAFVLNITGAVGAIGWVSWEAFKKLTLGTAASAGGGAPTPADAGSQTVVIAKPGGAGVSVDGLVLVNPTPATAAVPAQNAPRIRLQGQVWNSTAPGASNTDDWTIESFPLSGPTPGQWLKFSASANGAPSFTPFSVRGSPTASKILLQNPTDPGTSFANGLEISTQALDCFIWNYEAGSVSFGTSNVWRWNIQTDGHLTAQADNTLDIGKPGANRPRTGYFGKGVAVGPVTFANLPAAPVEGMLCAVTDSTVNTWGTVIAGGGANHVLAYYNGTNWIVK